MALHRKRQETEDTQKKTITDSNYVNNIALMVNTPTVAKFLLHSLEQAAGGMGFYVNTHKTEYMCFNQSGDITLNGGSLNQMNKFTYIGSSVSFTENDIKTRLAKAWTALHRLSVIWKSDLSDKIKCNYLQAAVVSILLYGFTTWSLTKRTEEKKNLIAIT